MLIWIAQKVGQSGKTSCEQILSKQSKIKQSKLFLLLHVHMCLMCAVFAYFSITSLKWMPDCHEVQLLQVKQRGTHLHTLLQSWHSVGHWRTYVTRWQTAQRLVLNRAWTTALWKYRAGIWRSFNASAIGYTVHVISLRRLHIVSSA